MADIVVIEFTRQFCRGENDITGDFYRDADADTVRFWQAGGDPFCLAEVSRVGNGPWRITGSDGSGWTEVTRTFNSPYVALRALLPADRYVLTEVTE